MRSIPCRARRAGPVRAQTSPLSNRTVVVVPPSAGPMRKRAAFGQVLRQHFPHVPPVPEAERRHWPSPGALRAARFRQWRAAGAMMRYLNRFPDAYTLVDPRA